jgi:hypothetical protein
VRHAVAIAIALPASLALADKKSPRDDVFQQTENLAMPYGMDNLIEGKPRFVFRKDGFAVSPTDLRDMASSSGAPASSTRDTVSLAIDEKSAWVALDLEYREQCGMAECMHDPPVGHGHITALFDSNGGWHPVAWHHADSITGKEQAAALAKGAAPEGIPRKIDAGAEEVAKKFAATIGDPKALAKTVSQRNDVVLYGSELAERYVGGDNVRAQLAKWKLAFKVRDGVQAGITSSKTTAWVAANLDATKPGDKKSTPYRALFVYEKHEDTGWDIVQLHFSFYKSP